MNIDLRRHRIDERSGPDPAGSRQVIATESDLIRPLRIHSLGRFSVQLDRQELTSNVKTHHRRPLELLQVLIAFGGRGVHADLLSQSLWPDAEGDKAQNSFDVTLHRLRQLLDLKDLFLVHDHHLTLNSELAWVDVWAFERAVNHAERLLHRLHEPAAARELVHSEERLLALYQGTFLEREAARPWSLSLRERLHSKLLRHLIEAGRAWETAGDWERAIRYYRKGLEIDPLIETLYLRLMLCFRDSGCIPEALTTYQRCRRVLAEQLQIEPSRPTRKLYNSLKA